MPYKKKYTKRPYKRKPRIYGTKASFMPKQLALKRYGQVSTRTFYFKASGSINSDNVGDTQYSWLTSTAPVIVGNPRRMPDIADSYIIAECYSEYKVLAIKVRLFAANIGTEVGQLPSTDPPPPIHPRQPGFDRGDTVCYLDQEIRPLEPEASQILNVMNLGSCRMIPSRISKYTKVLYRKKGLPGWGCCDRTVPVAQRVPDPWYAGCFLLGNNARQSLGVRPLWFFTVTYKIIFRGRNFTP